MKTWTIFEPQTVLQFGKYNGKSLEEVAQADAQYIYWCVKNIEKFLIDKDLFLSYQDKYKQEVDFGDKLKGETFILTCNNFMVNQFSLDILRNRWKRYESRSLKRDYYSSNDSFYNSSLNSNPYYNDNLDMDQQDPEFWNNL